MHWILQRNLINPTDLARFEQALQHHQTPYSLVSLVPFFHELAEEPTVPSADRIFVYGSTGLGHVAKARAWNPGYFDEHLDYELMLASYGRRALNADAICGPLGSLSRVWDEFFIRPVLDSKSFAGSLMTWDELEDFRAGVASVADAPDVTLRLTDRVVMAPLTRIEAEFRLFVIGGDVVTGSRYKVGDRLSVSSVVPPSIVHYARECMEVWRPNEAFTFDVALTSDGPRVIELNSANSAGVYACDVDEIVRAVNERL